MHINRRDAATALLVGVAASALPRIDKAHSINESGHRTVTLSNGFRTHYIANDSGYVAATLVLRSNKISHDGLAHICEHTSCAGAAGAMSAAKVRETFKDYVQEGNASTELGALRWQASFLPQYLPEVMGLLAAVALDQKFDVETVEAQAHVVLEELYLNKYSADKRAQHKLSRELFGPSHPYAKDTMEEEVARCKVAPAKLAAQLRNFATAVRLPANMDLFLVGSIEPSAVERLVNQHFGRYAFAQGPHLQIPRVDITRAYKAVDEPSQELRHPMTELQIAWNTGECIKSDTARVLLALSEYLSTALFDELREKDGDTYTPQVQYEPDACSGVFRIGITSSKDPQVVEKRIFDVVDKLKASIDDKELTRLRDRMQLKRCKEGKENEALLSCLADRTLDGGSINDLAAETVTKEEVLAAARKHIPSHRRAYVRLALNGQ